MKKMINKKIIHEGTGEELLVCPRCHIYMKKLQRKGVVIDICKKCNGMWLDPGEIEQLAQMGTEREQQLKGKIITKDKANMKTENVKSKNNKMVKKEIKEVSK